VWCRTASRSACLAAADRLMACRAHTELAAAASPRALQYNAARRSIASHRFRTREPAHGCTMGAAVGSAGTRAVPMHTDPRPMLYVGGGSWGFCGLRGGSCTCQGSLRRKAAPPRTALPGCLEGHCLGALCPELSCMVPFYARLGWLLWQAVSYSLMLLQAIEEPTCRAVHPPRQSARIAGHALLHLFPMWDMGRERRVAAPKPLLPSVAATVCHSTITTLQTRLSVRPYMWCGCVWV
jgi:hypothetical protein